MLVDCKVRMGYGPRPVLTNFSKGLLSIGLDFKSLPHLPIVFSTKVIIFLAQANCYRNGHILLLSAKRFTEIYFHVLVMPLRETDKMVTKLSSGQM